jgi:hypothetical protein
MIFKEYVEGTDVYKVVKKLEVKPTIIIKYNEELFVLTANKRYNVVFMNLT